MNENQKNNQPPGIAAAMSGAPDSPDDAVATDATGPNVIPASANFPIVGIGASAGGLAAFESFFSAIPADRETGMAFVLVQHLAPDHKSILTELIKRYTRMQVQEVTDGMTVKPDCAYIIPPNLDMALLNGKLHLLEPSAPRGLRLPIDFFFRSLAQDRHERAICIVLSGTGSDGTLGARAIKGEGGMVIAQTPATAAYDGMPRSVIATGLVDFLLSPADMPAHLIDYVAHAFGGRRYPNATPMRCEDALNKICILLRDQTSHDFSQYKQSTLVRRIERRMALHRIGQQSGYIRYLQQNPAEIEALFHDLLVGVTSFFRDPEAFEALQRDVIPSLFAGKPAGAPVRVWVCGCSSGEEAYSIAILLQEHLQTLKRTYRVQVFATDVDPRAIEQARTGVYLPSSVADIAPDRLARFFSEDAEGGVYRIQKTVRDLLVFSEQDLIRDPPFSRMDLISCRNLLIYFNSDLQKKLIPLFHYSLNPGGVLFLGSSETVGEALTQFAPLHRKLKLYVRQESLPGTALQVPGAYASPSRASGISPPAALEPRRQGGDLRALTEQALLRHYNPVGILTDGLGEILYIHGRTGQYLEPTAGNAAMNLFDMAREGLRRELTIALQRAVARKESLHLPGLLVKSNGDFSAVDLTVGPAQGYASESLKDLYLVVLEARPMPAAAAPSDATGGATLSSEHDARIKTLELELRARDEYLVTTLEEMQTANEELKSINEEMQSVNEELQSTNEELETSKEELQSVNEELATVNAELQNKIADLSRANNDMNNLLAGTGVATLFVDRKLRIVRFTPTATQMIKLIQTDIGRSVGDIVSNLLNYNRLVEDAHTVLKRLTPLEREVQTQHGNWYLMRIGPYVTLDNVIEGAVITFVDISARKRAEQALNAALNAAGTGAESVADTVRKPLVVLDESLCAISVNRAFCQYFASVPATLGQPLPLLGNGQGSIPALRRHLLDFQTQKTDCASWRIGYDFPPQSARTLLCTVCRLDSLTDRSGAMLLTIQDVSEQIPESEKSLTLEPAHLSLTKDRDV